MTTSSQNYFSEDNISYSVTDGFEGQGQKKKSRGQKQTTTSSFFGIGGINSANFVNKPPMLHLTIVVILNFGLKNNLV